MAEEIVVVYTKGKVFAENSSQERNQLQIGDQITEDFKIITDSNGFAVFKIARHSHFKIEENTEIYIHELPYFFHDSDELEQGGVFELIKGTFITHIEKKSGIESMKIVSNKVTLGVRGTRFLANKDEQDEALLLSVDEGQVEIVGPEGKQIDFLEKDESIEVVKGGKFSKRQKFNFSKKIDWSFNHNQPALTFRSFRPQAKDELKKRRQAWTKDPNRIERFKNSWEQKRTRREQKVQNLKSGRKLILKNEKKIKSSRSDRNRFLQNNKSQNIKERFKQRRNDLESSQSQKSKVKKRNANQTRKKKSLK